MTSQLGDYWPETGAITSVIGTEAEGFSESVFLAVHQRQQEEDLIPDLVFLRRRDNRPPFLINGIYAAYKALLSRIVSDKIP